MEMNTFIADLNTALSKEYAAAIQYYQHAATLTGVYFAFQKELLDHAGDEIEHAKILNDHITYLKGIPLTSVGPIFSNSRSQAMLQQDYIAETEAVGIYRQLIVDATELGLIDTIPLLQDILMAEVGHLTDIRSILES
jgi:bacterioferritin